MNKDGFTLAELLAVIALLAILSIFLIPTFLNMYRKAVTDSFNNELNIVVRTAKQKYVLDWGVPQTFSNTSNPLDLTGSPGLQYCISIDSVGNVVTFKATNGRFKYENTENVIETSSDDITRAEDGYVLTCNNEFANTTTNLFSIKTSPGQSVGETLTKDNTTVFDSYNSAVTAYGHPYFTKHVVNASNVITSSYIGFIHNSHDYYLMGSSSSGTYDTNQSVLNTAFGSGNCTTYNSGITSGNNIERYECYNASEGLYATAYIDGSVSASNGTAICKMEVAGNSYCGN